MRYLPTEIADDARPLFGQDEYDDPATPDDLARYFEFDDFEDARDQVLNLCDCFREPRTGLLDTRDVDEQLAKPSAKRHRKFGNMLIPTDLFTAFVGWVIERYW